MTEDKDLKIEINNKYCIENISFKLLRLWMHNFQGLISLFNFVSCVLRAQVNKTLILYMSHVNLCPYGTYCINAIPLVVKIYWKKINIKYLEQ